MQLRTRTFQVGNRLAAGVCFLSLYLFFAPAQAADHNDPNAVNSIFSNVPISAADLYGMFGYPSDDTDGGEKVVVQLTFASIPSTGVFDRDVLYKILFDPDPRTTITHKDQSLDSMLAYAAALKDKYLKLKAAEVRVTFNAANQARLDFLGFPGGDFNRVVDTSQVLTIGTPNGHAIKVFIGGRDDPFFNDLPGFFRSINYGPQFYKIPNSAPEDQRELQIPKTLLELEDNTLFNFNPEVPRQGRGVKLDLPDLPLTWNGKRFYKDREGRYRFVYAGVDAQRGINVNAIVLEIPLAFITERPQVERVVQIWGESWVLKAAGKIATRGSESFWSRLKAWFAGVGAATDPEFDTNIAHYKRIDTVGVPFLDAGLSERHDDRQLGADNISLARDFVTRLGHLGWGFGPSISALGLGTCFDHGHAPVSVYKKYLLATAAFPRAKKCIFQPLNMPDDSWRKTPDVDIALKRVFEVFIPNVTAIDMDTTGTWPYGRRPEDQVATRFLSVFLDMQSLKGCAGKQCNIETLGSQALWDSTPIMPQTPPNPLANDKPFLKEFPYLAEPW